MGLTTLNTRHPLLEFLEAADVRLSLRSGGRGFVERMERRELRGSGSWVGGYHAYFVTPSTSGVDKFHCVPHADVAWAVGSLVYGLFRRQLVPVDEAHLSDCLFGVQDVLLKQEMKSWFVADWIQGKCVARPIIKGFDATSPGPYHSVNDYLQTNPDHRGAVEMILRIEQLLIPSRRCGGEQRDFTMKADGQAVRYREDASGQRVVVSREGAGVGPSPEDILRLANQRRAGAPAESAPPTGE